MPPSCKIHPATNAINDIDVLLGKGAHTNKHPGNKAFRNEIKLNHEHYDSQRDGKKGIIAQNIVHKFLAQGTRFLKQDNTTGMWEEVGVKCAYKKAQNTLREGAPLRCVERRKALQRDEAERTKTETTLVSSTSSFAVRPMPTTSSLFQMNSGISSTLFERSSPHTPSEASLKRSSSPKCNASESAMSKAMIDSDAPTNEADSVGAEINEPFPLVVRPTAATSSLFQMNSGTSPALFARSSPRTPSVASHQRHRSGSRNNGSSSAISIATIGSICSSISSASTISAWDDTFAW